MEITQVELTFVELQDRVVARINLGSDKHLSLILTRRISKFMIENLASFLNVDLAQVFPMATKTPLDAQQSSGAGPMKQITPQQVPQPVVQPVESAAPPPGVQRDLPFEERSPEGSLLDKGYEPALILNASCTRTDEGLTFTLFVEDAQPMNLNLTEALATGIYQLLLNVVKRAQWFEGFVEKSKEETNQAAMPTEEEKKSITYH